MSINFSVKLGGGKISQIIIAPAGKERIVEKAALLSLFSSTFNTNLSITKSKRMSDIKRQVLPENEKLRQKQKLRSCGPTTTQCLVEN